MEKKKYPLFVIDSSRDHGRGQETDYISCTSFELPFVASVTLHTEEEFKDLYDAKDVKTTWSDPRNGIRMRIKVLSQLPDGYSESSLRSLLRRAMKEVITRKKPSTINVTDIKEKDVVQWAEILLSGVRESLRDNPADSQQKMNYGILKRIIEKFNNVKEDEL